MNRSKKMCTLTLLLFGFFTLAQDTKVAFAELPRIVAHRYSEPQLAVVDRTPIGGGSKYSTQNIRLSDNQFSEIYKAVPETSGPRLQRSPQGKPVLGTFVHGPNPEDLYVAPAPVLPDAADVVRNPESIDNVGQAYESAAYYYEYASICARIAQDKCQASNLIGSASYWAKVADCSSQWASVSRQELQKLKDKFAVGHAGTPIAPGDSTEHNVVPYKSTERLSDTPNGGPGSPSHRQHLQAQIEQIERDLGKLREDAADLQDEIADAMRGNRFSSITALQSTLDECRRMIAELSRERAEIQAQLQKARQ